MKIDNKSQNISLFEKFIQSEYEGELNDCKYKGGRSALFINYNDLINYFKSNSRSLSDEDLRQLLRKYEKKLNKDREISDKISIFLKEVPENVRLQDLDADWNGRFISTTCMIKTITDTAPSVVAADYVCQDCQGHTIVSLEASEKLEMPTRCINCGSKHIKFDSDSSIYKNYAYMKLEVPLELRNNGKTKAFIAYIEDYLATTHHDIQAGDVCNVIGWFKIRPGKEKNALEFIIEVHNIMPLNKDLEESNITEKDKEQILKLSKEPNVFDKFVESVAPDMYGYHDVKKGLVLQLFEGCRPHGNEIVTGEDRWTIHILIIGDPGMGKSKLSQGVHLHSPKSVVSNGASSTKAGLVCAVTKDTLSGAWITDAGAIVLADGGLLIIDEFDKLIEEAQTGLNEPMEQLIVSSAKAGVVQTLTARTSVLALANPKYSKFNDVDSMKKQLDIVESTLSRFDLVFAIRDIINVEKDRELAHNILNKTYKNKINDDDIIPDTLFKKYINYAKLNVFPEMSQEANDFLEEVYVQVRMEANENPDNKPITMRDLLAMKRLAVARAKVELRETVSMDDARAAVEIYTKSLESIGLDLTTVGEKQSVLSQHESKLIKDAEEMIRELFDNYGTFIDSNEKEDVMLELRVRVGSIKTRLTAEDIYREAYNNVKRNYHE